HGGRLNDLLNHAALYIHKVGSVPGCTCENCPRSTDSSVEQLCFDPIILIFEFANLIRLRENQLELMSRMISSIESSTPLWIQLMMGQGKTTVIGPLIAVMAAQQGSR